MNLHLGLRQEKPQWFLHMRLRPSRKMWSTVVVVVVVEHRQTCTPPTLTPFESTFRRKKLFRKIPKREKVEWPTDSRTAEASANGRSCLTGAARCRCCSWVSFWWLDESNEAAKLSRVCGVRQQKKVVAVSIWWSATRWQACWNAIGSSFWWKFVLEETESRSDRILGFHITYSQDCITFNDRSCRKRIHGFQCRSVHL